VINAQVAKSPLVLSANPLAVLPEGGIALFEDTHFCVRESAKEIWEKYHITTPESLLSLVLLLKNFTSRYVAHQFLTIGLQKGVITKEHLFTLYRMQNTDMRSNGSFITLEEIWDIHCSAFSGEDKEDKKSIQTLIRDDIISVANHFMEINEGDVDFFFMRWFYRSEEPLPFTKEFFLHWYKRGGVSLNERSGKLASLIAIHLYNAYPECVELDEVIHRFLTLASADPSSHGIHRFGFLCFRIAGDDVKKRKKVFDAWATAIGNMLDESSWFFHGEFLLSIFLRLTDVTQEEKEALINIVDARCIAIAEKYLTFVSSARNKK